MSQSNAVEEYGNKVGSTNVYTCPACGEKIGTIHVDAGVTPFMVSCKRTLGCRGFMQSGFYREAATEINGEWYKPKPDDECMANEAVKDHVDHGGLMLRMLTQPEAKAT